jgi:hypothetical protein
MWQRLEQQSESFEQLLLLVWQSMPPHVFPLQASEQQS